MRYLYIGGWIGLASKHLKFITRNPPSFGGLRADILIFNTVSFGSCLLIIPHGANPSYILSEISI